MNDKQIRTLDDVRAFLAGTTGIEFSIEGKDARYRWIEQTLEPRNGGWTPLRVRAGGCLARHNEA